jgi:hypothetical protein
MELVDPSEAAGLPGATEEALGLNGAPVLSLLHPLPVTTTTTVRRHPRSRTPPAATATKSSLLAAPSSPNGHERLPTRPTI